MNEMNLDRYFNSKILLFGEYGVIHNSQALAIPYELFRGRLAFPQCDQHREFTLNHELKAFARYLEQIQINHLLRWFSMLYKISFYPLALPVIYNDSK